MKLSTRGRYALSAMVYLASQNDKGPQTLSTIARDSMPSRYLEQLLGQLRRGGLVTTVRGAQGGYAIARPPEQITVANILEATEGPLQMSACDREEKACPQSGSCCTQNAFSYLEDNINRLMHSITLWDIISNAPFNNEESNI